MAKDKSKDGKKKAKADKGGELEDRRKSKRFKGTFGGTEVSYTSTAGTQVVESQGA